MERDTSMTAADVYRPGGKSLQESYEHHDTGEDHLITWLQKRGFTVAEWGIDERDDDGEDGLLYDDKMDVKVYDPSDNLVGLVDVKTKTSAKWMGQFNARHYDNYLEHAQESAVRDSDTSQSRPSVAERAVPTFIAMYQVNNGDVVDGFVTNVLNVVGYRSDEDDFIGQFPDGNNKFVIPHGYRREPEYMVYKFTDQQHNTNVIGD